MSITGKIYDWGVTDGTYYLNTNFGEGSDKLTQYNVGDKFSFTDLSCPEGDTYGDYDDFKCEQVCKVPARTYSTSTGDQDHIQTNLWYNYCKPCEDYVRAKNLTGKFDQWDKEIDLSWELEPSIFFGRQKIQIPAPGRFSVIQQMTQVKEDWWHQIFLRAQQNIQCLLKNFLLATPTMSHLFQTTRLKILFWTDLW